MGAVVRVSRAASEKCLRDLLCLATLVTISCGGGHDEIAACRARAPLAAESIYGCVTQSNDVGNPPPSTSPLSGFSVEVFPSEPPSTPGDGLAPLIGTTSDLRGYYEVGLPSGSCWLCTSFRRCVEVTLPAAERMALDYDFGAGPGWSPR